MAQKQYGIIPHDTSQVGYGQDTPVADHEAMKAAMVDKIKKHRKKKKETGVIKSVKDTAANLRKKQKALDAAASDTP
jgi:alpha-D-ribose 1-methylphosphonate 5-triphosphate synthase subunit PhnG